MSSLSVYTKPVVDALKTVFISQPANNIARYSANAARALYVVGVAKGLWDAYQEVQKVRTANAKLLAADKDSKLTKSWVKAGFVNTAIAFTGWSLVTTGGQLVQSFKNWTKKEGNPGDAKI